MSRQRRTWIVSDWHFHHKNMLRTGKIAIRPFDTLDEMHKTIIDNHNAVVAPNDLVICLGDVTLERNPNSEALHIVTKLAGEKWLLLGNHDHYDPEQYRGIAGFSKITATLTRAGFILSHIPVHPTQMGRFKGNIHGHTHENHVQRFDFELSAPKRQEDFLSVDAPSLLYATEPAIIATVSDDPRYFNACIEPLNYTPILLDEIIARMEKQS